MSLKDIRDVKKKKTKDLTQPKGNSKASQQIGLKSRL